jgi:hypothetical protein
MGALGTRMQRATRPLRTLGRAAASMAILAVAALAFGFVVAFWQQVLSVAVIVFCVGSIALATYWAD